jgi:outer membrane protein assembly factor BamE (lipoprotein component of BamABCDE complex)
MKKIFFVILTLILVIIILFIYHTHLSKQAVIGKANLVQIKEIEIGMDTLEVLEIMGEPIKKRNFKNEIFYDYELPTGSSGQLTISFDTLGIVIDKGNIPPLGGI